MALPFCCAKATTLSGLAKLNDPRDATCEDQSVSDDGYRG